MSLVASSSHLRVARALMSACCCSSSLARCSIRPRNCIKFDSSVFFSPSFFSKMVASHPISPKASATFSLSSLTSSFVSSFLFTRVAARSVSVVSFDSRSTRTFLRCTAVTSISSLYAEVDSSMSPICSLRISMLLLSSLTRLKSAKFLSSVSIKLATSFSFSLMLVISLICVKTSSNSSTSSSGLTALSALMRRLNSAASSSFARDRAFWPIKSRRRRSCSSTRFSSLISRSAVTASFSCFSSRAAILAWASSRVSNAALACMITFAIWAF
mmetsp:Transcript_848/g.2527  ORF Transcript_848/g.2527 Transcript_848/m.2527 type:complete len:272 (-) Transcript_848:607-1422(-)